MHERKHYIVQCGKLVEVPEDIRKAIDSLTNAVKYRARDRKECSANRQQSAYCEGDCIMCRYYRPRKISVEERDERKDGQIVDADAGMAMRVAEMLADMALADEEGDRIGRYIADGYPQTQIAEMLGITVSVYCTRLKRIGRKLREE